LPVARLARRLRDDFELDRAGLALALRLMQRIDSLEQEVERLRARLPVRHNQA
jgi:chaperone modulatory protein CbpM